MRASAFRRSASALRWRRAVGADIPALSAFLGEAEERRVGFSGRLLREADPSSESSPSTERSRGAPCSLRLPSPLRGAVWVVDGGESAAGDSVPLGIAGAILCHPTRLVFPIFPAPDACEAWELEGSALDRDISLLASSFPAASVIGMEEDVVRYEEALGLSPRASVAYRMMTKAATAPSIDDPSRIGYPGLSVRRAFPEDLDALLPLQEAYEREEVLTRIHAFNPAACKASLARALARQLVFAAEEGGVIIGKAGH